MVTASAALPAEAAQELLRELRGAVMRQLGERLTHMFEDADDLLFTMSEKAENNEQQRTYFDTMRALRLGRTEIAEQFEAYLRESFDGLHRRTAESPQEEIDFERLALQDSEDLEETIAVSNMVGKAEGLYKHALFEIERRFDWLAQHSALRIPFEAVAPVSYCEAFRSGLKTLDLDFGIKLVLYKVYDRLVVSELVPMYAETLALLDRFHVRGDKAQAPRPVAPMAPPMPPPPAAAPPPGAEMDAGDTAPGGYPGGYPGNYPGNHPGNYPGGAPAGFAGGGYPGGNLDPQTLGALQQYFPGLSGAMPLPPGYPAPGMAPPMMPPMPSMPSPLSAPMPGMAPVLGGGGSYSGGTVSPYAASMFAGHAHGDAMLASELMAAAHGQAPQGVDASHAWAMTQRAGLVGRMFNEIVADPNLPRGVTGALEELRFPVIKTALSDVSFFSNPQHPVRSLINDLASMAASTRAGGPEAADRFEQLVHQVRQQFDVDAEAVRPKAHEASPLEQGEIERFLDEQLAQGRERRKVIVEKVRKVVSQELDLQTLSHPLPDAVQPLLRSGWGPMMAMRLLRNGHDSELWRAGMELLHRVLFALNPQSPNARSPAEREALRRDLSAALGEAGMTGERIDSLLQGLDNALNEVPSSEHPEDAPTREIPPVTADVTPPPSSPLPSTDTLLDRLLLVGTWFRVYDRTNHDTRWLKLMSWYPQTHRVSFAEFDGNNALTLHTRDLLEDLLLGRSEPIDTSPAALSLLAQLRDSHAAESAGRH